MKYKKMKNKIQSGEKPQLSTVNPFDRKKKDIWNTTVQRSSIVLKIRKSAVSVVVVIP